MVTVNRRLLLPFLAPILVPLVCSVLASNPVQAGETPSFLLGTAPTERRSPPVTWLDDFEHRLMTYFTRRRRWLADRNESCRMRNSALSILEREESHNRRRSYLKLQ
jgi:hypothetical protein